MSRENQTDYLCFVVAYLGIDLAVLRVVLIIELSQSDREALRNVMDISRITLATIW